MIYQMILRGAKMKQTWRKYWCVVFVVAATTQAEAAALLIERALTCRLEPREIAGLMQALPAQIAEMAKPAQQFGAPTGNLYRLAKPVSAFGYASKDVYVTPTRIMLVVSNVKPEAVVKKLKLEPAKLSPASRQVNTTASVVSYELHQEGLVGKVLVGCEYDDQGAATWGAE